MKFEDEFRITMELQSEAANKAMNLNLSADGYYKSIFISLADCHIAQGVHDKDHFLKLADEVYEIAKNLEFGEGEK